jgi:hypothetical protein
MADSDDPCDDVVGNNLTGWVKTNKEYKKEEKETVPLSYARFEHG